MAALHMERRRRSLKNAGIIVKVVLIVLERSCLEIHGVDFMPVEAFLTSYSIVFNCLIIFHCALT
jgi:hypothetical protein